MRGRPGVAALLAVVLAAPGLAGCTAAGGETADIAVVTSTDVYAAVVQELVHGLPAGRVSVSALISDPSLDPHSYEASTRNELAVSRADLIVENGGGYDDFVDTLRDAAGANAPVINAVDLSGHADDADLNEHVFYDLPTVEIVAHRVTAFLISRDGADAALLRGNAAAFAASLHRLESAAARIGAARRGVAITEPVPLYLLQACGLHNLTPGEFSNAIEEGTDASPRVLQATLELFRTHRVALLVYNEQTGGPQTDDVIAAARANGIPIVGVTETLPAGLTYVQWMRGILRAIDEAVS